MATKRKSIIEEALLEAKSVEDALKANTKEILASTMKEEINSVVRESLEEQEMDDMDMEDTEGIENNDEGLDDNEMEDEQPGEGEGLEMELGDEEGGELDLELGDEEGVELDMELGDEEGMELDMELGDEEGSELPMELGDEDLEGLDDLADLEGGADEMDLTMADDSEVLKVFKSMSDDDEIEVVKDDGGISLKDNSTGAEYYIKESEEDELYEGELCEDCGDDSEVVYEVEMDEAMAAELDLLGDEDDELEDDYIEENKIKNTKYRRYSGAKVGRTDETKRRKKPVVRESRKPVTNGTVRKESYEKLLKEYKVLKGRNTEYKEALKVFKTKINEVALFNQNLAHVTKIFTEHSTTKKEKMKILGRFDNVETIKESKTLYKSITGELGDKTSINETVEKKINKTIDSSKSNLNESTAYVDPQINKIKDLMKRIS